MPDYFSQIKNIIAKEVEARRGTKYRYLMFSFGLNDVEPSSEWGDVANDIDSPRKETRIIVANEHFDKLFQVAIYAPDYDDANWWDVIVMHYVLNHNGCKEIKRGKMVFMEDAE